MSWWLSMILFSWTSIKRLSLLSLQKAHTLFLYFLWAVCTDTSSVSEHETQSPEAVPRSDSYIFSLNDSESEEAWSPVLFELLAAVPSSRSMVALVGLEGGLTGSCPCCLKLVPVPNINSCMLSLPWTELCSLLALTSWESTWVLLLSWLLSQLLEEQPCFFCVEMTRNSANRHPLGESP